MHFHNAYAYDRNRLQKLMERHHGNKEPTHIHNKHIGNNGKLYTRSRQILSYIKCAYMFI